jgi:hypothetical protein
MRAASSTDYARPRISIDGKSKMKTTKFNRFFPRAEAIVAALTLLAGIGCGSTKVSTQTNSSVGQQLMDLQKAHDEGVIDDKEYARLRKSLVKKND